jgi:hypothetical protein
MILNVLCCVCEKYEIILQLHYFYQISIFNKIKYQIVQFWFSFGPMTQFLAFSLEFG